MRPRTTTLLAVATAVVVLNACGAQAGDDREAVISLPDVERVTSSEPDPTGGADAGAITENTASTSTSTTATTEDATGEEAETETSTAESQDLPINDEQLDTAGLDDVLSDLDGLLTDLTNSFEQTEGDIQP